MNILLLAGAGTSVELGVPGMIGMAEEFLDHVRQWDVDPDLVNRLIGDPPDVEHLIEALDSICTARASLEAIGEDTIPLERAVKVRAEIEWFVQHVAERVVASEATLMWGSLLRAASALTLTLVTTNYDRAIELAANAQQLAVDDGFEQFTDGETASWIGFGRNGDRFPLVKLHGSTDWYATGELENPTKLRHPMPLFGHATLRLAGGQELKSAIILPSREKLFTREPYMRLSQTFLNAADGCDLAIFVGSSLRDHHIRSAAQTIARRAPVFIVNPDGASYGLENVWSIKQYASMFLMATLPNALVAANTVDVLRSVAASSSGEGILRAVQEALDVAAPPNLRCRAVEKLDEMEVTLDPFLLQKLVTDADPQVARYSLGLVSLSAKRDALIEEAAVGVHASEPAFRDDLQLLQNMMRNES